MNMVERLQKECDRHVIGYPGPRRDVAETLQLAAEEIERLEKALEAAREALEDIARQRLSHEMTKEARSYADWLGGYDECVRTARLALSQKKEG